MTRRRTPLQFERHKWREGDVINLGPQTCTVQAENIGMIVGRLLPLPLVTEAFNMPLNE
jgi:hypothetical protein